MKIKEGYVHDITCPAFGCTKLVPVEVIENVVSRDMARRYLQFDIKVCTFWPFTVVLTVTTLWTNSSEDKLMIFFPEKRL